MIRRLSADEVDAAAQRAQAAFGATEDVADVRDRLTAAVERGSLFGFERGGETVAHCRLDIVGHWFGGRRVPVLQVAGVAVVPEHRAQGVASAFMRAALAHGVERGAGLSLLFPATTALYRKLGWEHAGTFHRWRLDARLVPPVGEPMRAADDEDWPSIRLCHDRYAAAANGPAVRGDDRWAQLRRARFGYVLDGEDGLEAYALVDHHRPAGSWQYSLEIHDWAALSAQGMTALVGFVGRHGTLADSARLSGPLPDMWATFTVEQSDVQAAGGLFWMARGLDPVVAVTARGFPPGVSTSVTIAVDDSVLPAARGPWRLVVAETRGRLEPAVEAEVRLDARAFGPLFTGFRTPRELALAGLADGPPAALDRLGSCFAGPVPRVLDFF